MAINYRQIVTGEKIVPKTTSQSDSLGDLEVLSSTNKLNFHNGSSNSPVVTESHTATLTNKTIDAPANTITNIANVNIATSAAIARSKLAAGTANAVVINDGSGNFSNLTMTSAQIIVANGSGVPTAVTMSGDATISNTGVVTVTGGGGSGFITAVSDTNSIDLTVTVSTLSADVRFANGTIDSNSSGIKVATGGINNNEVNAAAAIARSKLASGTNNAVVINNGSGVQTDLAPGTSGYFLKSNGAGSAPSWVVSPTNKPYYTFLVGSATDVTNGIADYSSLITAIAACVAGNSILLLQSYTGTESITIGAELLIRGQGRGSVINGSVTFSSGGAYSILSDVYVQGNNVTLNSGANGVSCYIYLDASKSFLVDSAVNGELVIGIQG